MIKLIVKYWDIVAGILVGIGLTFVADFQVDEIQLFYSVIILILLSIGIFKFIKEDIEKHKRNTIIDKLINSQLPLKALDLTQHPIEKGMNLASSIKEKEMKAMSKIKTFFDKFKGIILAITLLILTVIELCGGYLNELFGGVVVYNDIELIPFITLVASVVVGIISNKWDSTQKAKIKALFSKTTTNELVTEEIKKTLKDKKAELKAKEKTLTTQEQELKVLQSEAESLKNIHTAKLEMYKMEVQLATLEDVTTASTNYSLKETEIVEKKKEIEVTKTEITNLQTIISALESQL